MVKRVLMCGGFPISRREIPKHLGDGVVIRFRESTRRSFDTTGFEKYDLVVLAINNNSHGESQGIRNACNRRNIRYHQLHANGAQSAAKEILAALET